MKKALFIGALICAGAATTIGELRAHGGTYRGPGDTVPPGGGSPPGGATGPVLPGPTGPARPGPGGSSAPGPPTPGQPGVAPGPTGAGRTTPGRSVAPDLTAWDFWWGFNKDAYLELRSRVHEVEPWTGSDDWFLGRGESTERGFTLRPSPRVVREVVVPALLELLARESANDVLDATLLALAKIGEDGVDEIAGPLEDHLDHANQQVAETAAVALGILGSPESVPLLLELLRDTRAGRELVGRTNEVPYRTRAFAAYGLGLVAQRSSDHALRANIGASLVEILEAPHFATRDLKVAAMIAFGLCPLDWHDSVPVGEEGAESPRVHVKSREAQLSYLLDYLDPAGARAQRDTRHWFVRAHAPTALARLVEDDEGVHRERVARALLPLVGRHSKEQREIRQSCVLALGSLGDASDQGADDVDVEIRDELIRLVAEGEPMERRFALVSLACSAGRTGGSAGKGPAGSEGVAKVTDVLVRTLSRSKVLRTWAGLSIGILAHGLRESREPEPIFALRALADAARDCRRPAEIGAYVIGLGMARQASAEELLRERLEFFNGSDEAQGYCAVALGMIGARRQLERINEIVAGAEYRAPLLREAATALGILGDKDIVPSLVERLQASRGQATRAALATALGTIGDSRSLAPLLSMARDRSLTPSARGFAAAALGMVCDKDLLPWNSPISVGTNYRANTVTLTGGGAGILDLL